MTPDSAVSDCGAVGDFRPPGKRAGVYTEPSMIERSAFELADTEKKMVEATENFRRISLGTLICGSCRQAFPFGGMENRLSPRRRFSRVKVLSLVAHELSAFVVREFGNERDVARFSGSTKV